jgi:predicted metal-dependent peptidase
MLEITAEKSVFELGLRALMSTRSDDYRRTLKRPHRRVPDYPWGRRKEEQTRIVVAVDNSGSVSTRLLNRFFGEILKLSAISNDVQVIVADSDVHKVFQLKSEKDFQRVEGGGGTDFNPAIQYANTHFRDYDLMIYLTDGECSFPETKSTLPLIWVVTGVQDWPGKPTIFAPELERS